MVESPGSAGPACANCGAAWGDAVPAFCPHCGQESTLRPPSLGGFLQQFGGAYLSTEGALWRSLRLLLVQPGELTRQYLAGRRKHYVLPLRLYLTISLVVLLAVRLMAQVGTDAAVRPTIELSPSDPQALLELGSVRVGLQNGRFLCENLPRRVCARLERRVAAKPDTLAQEAADMRDRLVAAIGPAMFVMLPAFALWLKLAYLGHGVRYAEHLVFALHLHAFWFVLLGVTLLPLGGWETAAGLAAPLYAWLAMKRVYGGPMLARAVRSLLVVLLYAFTFVLTLAGASVWAVVGG